MMFYIFLKLSSVSPPTFFFFFSIFLAILDLLPFHINFVVYVQLLTWVQLFARAINCSMPGIPTIHYLPEFAQTHVLWVNDAIQ